MDNIEFKENITNLHLVLMNDIGGRTKINLEDSNQTRQDAKQLAEKQVFPTKSSSFCANFPPLPGYTAYLLTTTTSIRSCHRKISSRVCLPVTEILC
jgi:hypothetical protein